MRDKKPSLAGGRAIRRRAVQLKRADFVQTELLLPGQNLILLVRPAMEGVSLKAWAQSRRAEIDELLRRHGALLFRGFDLGSEESFQEVLAGFSNELLDYSYRSTPRTRVEGRVFTSTEYPADRHIPMHNEMSYSSKWPLKIWFFAAQAAEQGGETPIADSRKVLKAIDPAIRKRFEEKKVLYRRNYSERIDLPWQEVFQTGQKSDVERICRELGIEPQWSGEDHLTTTQVCQAVARHPRTGEAVWFNQAHLFHVSGLEPSVREMLLSEFGEEKLPRNAYYGDGTPFEESALDEIRAVYREHSLAFPWQDGDLLMLDNMLAAHGRRPFSGSRRVLVGMAESVTAREAACP